MKLFDKIKPVYFIDDDMKEAINQIDSKLKNIEIMINKKENIWFLNQK